jgi:hypothetical protein
MNVSGQLHAIVALLYRKSPQYPSYRTQVKPSILKRKTYGTCWELNPNSSNIQLTA